MLELLRRQAADLLDLTLTDEQLDRFELYYRQLIEWNSHINLTGITEYEAVQSRHFLDSLTLASPRLRGDPAGQTFDLSTARLIDIGAGGGFPGLPLKILYPQLRLTLVDSVGKKTAFLTQLAATLGLKGMRVLNDRAEELGQSPRHRQQYDLATGRAVAAWPVLAEYCLPLVRLGGLFVAPKKGDLSVELVAADKIAGLLGAKLRPSPTFELPNETGDPRRLVVAVKTGPTPRTYPRRTGLPAKEPL